MNLTVREVDVDDVFEDRARLHLSHRNGVRAGQILRLSANGITIPLVARGAPAKDQIWLDMTTREQFGVKPGEVVEFSVSAASIYDEVHWAWYATNPVYRIAARLSVLSLALGVVGLLLGILSLT